MITVKKLISELKKMPQNAIVAYQDHDAEEYMVSSWPTFVTLLDYDEIPENMKEDNIWGLKGVYVAIKGQ